ncbi:uncharacterized protein LOC131621993 [Vicia villosa]|uniref:uncharacterized protein LOC131621993 n=1 Tax=Vicia villosa TaxID=3911 RepID=UPI00273B8086|nr:uncharacterized protein LOC131621993 [Vicia villosa]
MLIALISKNKERFIDGTLPKPPISDVLYAPWIRRNTMVLAWIHKSISESIAKFVLWIDNAEDLYKFRQGNLDVSNYFTQMKVMWDELETYRPITACSYAIPFSCGALTSFHKYREHDYVIRFLKGLNEKFTQSKSQIMMMIPLPDIDKTFSLVIQQECELNHSQSTVSSSEDASAFHFNTSFGSNSGKSGNNYSKGKITGYDGSKGHSCVCTHCGRTNHTIETCFLKHGYPPGFKGKGKPTNSIPHSQTVASIETRHNSSQQH